MKRAVGSFLTLIISISAFSQADFRKGFIITTHADTVYGLIDYKGNKINAEECRFRKSADDDITVYTPEQILGYRYENSKFFVSKLVERKTTKRYFLEYLINGTVDIYFFRDSDGDHYYLDSGDGVLSELPDGNVEVFKDGERLVKKNTKYIGMLRAAFRESPTIARKAEKLELNHKDLIGIAKEYHTEVCSTESCIIYEKSLPRKIRSIGLVAAFNSYSFKAPTIPYPYDFRFIDGMKFDRIYYPSVGLFYRSTIPALNEKLYISWEATIQSRKISGTNTDHSAGKFVEDKYFLTLRQIVMNNTFAVGYQAPQGKIRPTVHVGGFLETFLKGNYQLKYTRTYQQSNVVTSSIDNEMIFSDSDFGLVFGAGIFSILPNQKHIIIDARYQLGKGVSMSGYLMNTSSIALLVRLGL
jgi:hypothetical protein